MFVFDLKLMAVVSAVLFLCGLVGLGVYHLMGDSWQGMVVGFLCSMLVGYVFAIIVRANLK